jgi:hypothetical protein
MLRIALLSVVLAAPAFAKDEAAKIITDKGSQFIRSDNKKALTVGAEFVAVADAATAAPVGKAVVMEVTGALARISLDEEATKGGAKFVLIPKAATGAPKADAPKADAPRPAGPKLDGKIEVGVLRVTFSNNTDASWTDCSLHFSDGRSYKVGEVVKHSDDTVMKVKFTSPPEPPSDHVKVACSEGESDFYFAKPQVSGGKLKGYATNDKGSVVIYNNTETAWTACDVSKPNGSHFVLGTLKGHDHDSIDRGRFVKEAEAAAKGSIELRCKEGQLVQALD